jgi:hypothetical protein
MYITYIPTGQLDRILVASSDNDMKRTISINLNYRYAVTGGTE